MKMSGIAIFAFMEPSRVCPKAARDAGTWGGLAAPGGASAAVSSILGRAGFVRLDTRAKLQVIDQGGVKRERQNHRLNHLRVTAARALLRPGRRAEAAMPRSTERA